MEPLTVEFLGETCNIEFKKYCYGRKSDPKMWAIQLWVWEQMGEEEGEGYWEPMATATFNAPDKFIPMVTFAIGVNEYPHDPDRLVFIKDWSENTGILEALVEAGIVHEPFGSFQQGFAIGQACRLTDKALEAARKENE